MKNYEKYIDVLKSGTVTTCEFVKKHILANDNCYNITCKQCDRKLFNWLDSEYEPQIDWSKVPVDTPVITDVGNRHFCKYENNRVFTFDDGTTSWTCPNWHNWVTSRDKTTVQLAREEDIEKYSI